MKAIIQIMNYTLGILLLVISSLVIEAKYKKHDKCVFPFKYQGRVYDDCIMNDAKAPWCSADANYKGLFHYCNDNLGDSLESNGAFLSAQKKLTENSETLKNTTYFSTESCENCGTQIYIVESSMIQLTKISDDNNRHIDFLLNVENENFKDVLNINYNDVKDYISCPSGWYPISVSECFHFKPNLNFADARRYCEEKGSQLATVSNLEENKLLVARANELYPNEGSLYCGFSDENTEGKWEWIDGSESNFTNWNTGEPNGARNENCLMVYQSNGKWNDVSCNVKLNAVCRGHILFVKN